MLVGLLLGIALSYLFLGSSKQLKEPKQDLPNVTVAQKPKKCTTVRAAKNQEPIINETMGIEVRTSRIGGTNGRGVFAVKKFRKGDIVEKCPLLVAHDDDWGDDHPLSNYLFEHSASKSRSALALGMGSLYNHTGLECNADYFMDGDVMLVKATRTIRPDEEITIDYGDEWWLDMDESEA